MPMNRLRWNLLTKLTFAAIVLSVVALASPRRGEAQGMAGTFTSLITSLNTSNTTEMQSYLADDFTLTFIGGTTLQGAAAQHLLVLLNTPITIISAMPGRGGAMSGSAILQFGDGRWYTVTYSGAMNAKVATLTIEGESVPQ